MTVLGEFEIPTEAFPLAETLAAVPDATVSLVRVTIAPELFSPYLWVAVGDFDAFRTATEHDPSVRSLQVLDSFDGVVLCRVAWDESAVAVADAFAATSGSVLDTYTNDEGWYVKVQFADREALRTFRSGLEEAEVPFRALSLTSASEQPTAELPFGLTQKQTEALLVAWESGYYEIPRRAKLEDIAEDLGISQQALSERLQRAHATLLGNTIARTLADGGWDLDGFGG